MNLIVCMSKNRVIGKENKMPWSLPNDLAYFKKTTLGKTVVMGRKTFESIGKNLPGRNNVILTRDPNFKADGCTIASNIEEVLKMPCDDVFIMGGSEIYSLFMPYIRKLYITQIDEEFDGDAFFPEIQTEEYQILSNEPGIRDEKNNYNYSYTIWRKSLKNPIDDYQ